MLWCLKTDVEHASYYIYIDVLLVWVASVTKPTYVLYEIIKDLTPRYQLP